MKLNNRLAGLLLGAGLALLASGAAAQTRFVHADSVNCRERPTTSSTSLERLTRNTRVTVTRQQDGWSLLDRTPACWVSSRFLETSAQSLTSPDRAAPRRDSPRSATPRRRGSGSSASPPRARSYSAGSCPCSGSRVCIGPRGGRYCITSGGNKRYGV